MNIIIVSLIRTFQLSEHPLVLTCSEKWLSTVDPLSNWSWSDPLSDNQQGHRTMTFNVLSWFGNANKSHVISRVIVLLAFLVCRDRDIKSGSSWVERHKAKKKLQLHMCGSPLVNGSLAIQLALMQGIFWRTIFIRDYHVALCHSPPTITSIWVWGATGNILLIQT